MWTLATPGAFCGPMRALSKKTARVRIPEPGTAKTCSPVHSGALAVACPAHQQIHGVGRAARCARTRAMRVEAPGEVARTDHGRLAHACGRHLYLNAVLGVQHQGHLAMQQRRSHRCGRASGDDGRRELRMHRCEALSNSRPRADLNCDRWIQSPECQPVHHEAICGRSLAHGLRTHNASSQTVHGIFP